MIKYGNICYRWKNDEVNLGDDIQILAIDYLYQCMGISLSEIVRIPFDRLNDFDGEGDRIILPIAFPLHSYVKDSYFTLFSDSIIPVFLNLSLYGLYLAKEDVDYLKKYEPIGCRDLNTVRILRKEGIMAYENGCITQIFPERVLPTVKQKVFLVDIDDKLYEHIPSELKARAEIRTHALRYSQLSKATREMAKEQLLEYAESAELVITSRLHCALPCIAMGIPVVFADENNSHRFEGIDRIATVYEKTEYDRIEWRPSPIDYREVKKRIIRLDSKRILRETFLEEEIREIDNIFSRDLQRTYTVDCVSDTLNFIDKLLKQDHGRIEYYLWGITPIAYTIYCYIQVNYPEAVLIGVIDKTKRIMFCGKMSEEKNIIVKKDAWVFVCTRNALFESKQFLADMEMKKIYQCAGNEYRF